MRERPPVILLPGAFGQELVYWNVWEYFLERDGFHVYPTSFPRFTMTDLTLSARLLAEKVEEVKAVEDVDRVALVGHSMGGLIGRHYLKFLDGHESVSRLTCLGTPHYGTWFGATAPLLRGSRQIVPGSDFLSALNDPKRGHGEVRRDGPARASGREGPIGQDVVGRGAPDHGGVPILNIWSPYDGVVIPARSSLLELPGVDNRALPFAGHWGLLFSRRAYRWVREALEKDAGLVAPEIHA